MVEKTIYIAQDGKMFENEEECLLYETNDLFSVAKKCIHLMSEDGIECFFDSWDEFEKALLTASTCYMNIDNNISKQTLCDIDYLLNDYYGLFARLPSCSGEYRWDSEEEEWISYEEDYKKFSYNWRHRRD